MYELVDHTDDVYAPHPRTAVFARARAHALAAPALCPSPREAFVLTGAVACALGALRRCGVAFSPGGDVLVSGSADATARLWRVEQQRSPTPLAEVKHPDAVSGVDFHPGGAHLCTACADSNVRVLNVRALPSAAAEPTVLRAHAGAVWSSAFSPSGEHIASASSDRSIALWDWKRAARVGTLHGHTNWVVDARFNGHGSALASASRDRSVRIWDVNTCDQVLELWGHESFTTCCAFGSGGSHMASQVFSGAHDKVVRQWDQNSGMEVAQFTGHVSGVYGLAVSGDGHVVATVSWDGTCRVWSVRMQKSLFVLPLQPNAAGASAAGARHSHQRLSSSRGLAVAMSAAGGIAVGGNGGALRVFEPPSSYAQPPATAASNTPRDPCTSRPAAAAGAQAEAKAPAGGAGGGAVEEWLVDALLEHLAAESRVDDFLDTHAVAKDEVVVLVHQYICSPSTLVHTRCRVCVFTHILRHIYPH